MNDADRLGAPDIGPKGLDPVWDEVGHDIMGWTHYGHYDRSGNPISMRDWCRLRAYSEERNNEYTTVAKNTVGDFFVSTVWVGLDHGLGIGRYPLIFETMVFRHTTGESDLDCRRYATEEEALKGHEEMCARVALFDQLER